jgi:hypothetical protein
MPPQNLATHCCETTLLSHPIQLKFTKEKLEMQLVMPRPLDSLQGNHSAKTLPSSKGRTLLAEEAA